MKKKRYKVRQADDLQLLRDMREIRQLDSLLILRNQITTARRDLIMSIGRKVVTNPDYVKTSEFMEDRIKALVFKELTL